MMERKYQVEVDLTNENMSQSLIAQLVGEGRRVLDVGCASGYLARVLRERGCSVSGIEPDEMAAEEAREYVDEIVIGDVECMDLVKRFGADQFDAVVFGDVLEHLSDPVAALRQAQRVLARGGSVVASIPNVAHGAVRLALLAGRFRYTPAGLLDTTHVRFYTRESIERLFAEADLTPVEMRRTELGLFQTEIDVREGDFAPDVVASVLEDPEATTYQFVLRALRSSEAAAADRERYERAQVERVRRHVLRSWAGQTQTPVVVAPIPHPLSTAPRLGVWGAFDLDDIRQAFLGRVTRHELARRLPGVDLRTYAPHGFRRPSQLDRGEPVQPLGPMGTWRAAELAGELAATVVTGWVPTTARAAAAAYGDEPRMDHPALFLARGLMDAGAQSSPMIWSAVSLAGAGGEQAADLFEVAPAAEALASANSVLPDPGVLAPRLFAPRTITRRLATLRALRVLPENDPFVLVQCDLRYTPHVSDVAHQLNSQLVRHPHVQIVVAELDVVHGDAAFARMLAAQLDRPPLVLGVDAGLDDLVAALASADGIIATSPTALAIAASFGRQTLALDLMGDDRVRDAPYRVTAPSDLGALGDFLNWIAAGAAPFLRRPWLAERQAAFDAHFDRLAERLRPSLSAGPARRADSDSTDRIIALQTAHRALRGGTNVEWALLAERVLAQQHAMEDLRPELEQVRAELDALLRTKTMRLVHPARQAYGRLRRLRR